MALNFLTCLLCVYFYVKIKIKFGKHSVNFSVKTQKTIRNLGNYWKPEILRIFSKYKAYIEEEFDL